jgi:RHS repeat-associated protein
MTNRKKILALLLAMQPLLLLAQTKPNAAITPTLAPLAAPAAYPGTMLVNYVRTWEAMQPIQNPTQAQLDNPALYKQATAYFDGLGRPLQEVVKGGSPDGTKDLVSTHLYDAYGREAQQYLPVPMPTNGGKFQLNPFAAINSYYSTQFADQRPFAETVFEASPLNRPLASFAPGNAWAGSKGTATERAIKKDYLINTAADSVRIWNTTYNTGYTDALNIPTSTATYPAGELYKNITTDEHGKQVVEYTDKSGQVILKKVQEAATPSSGHAGWLCTYYIYDDFSQLRCVVQPAGVQAAQQASWVISTVLAVEQCFRYEYDERRRMAAKRVPGAGWVYMVYDKRDRLAATQDANQRAANQWLLTFYDALNRPEATAIWNSSSSPVALQDAFKAITATNPNLTPAEADLTRLSYTYYDSHGFAGAAAYDGSHATTTQTNAQAGDEYAEAITHSTATIGLVTGTKTRVLGTNIWLTTTTRYDAKGRAIQVTATNHKGGTDKSTTQYSFTGKALSTTVVHSNPAALLAGTQTTTISTTTTYANNLPTSSRQKINNGNWQPMATLQYDDLGKTSRKTMGNGYNGGADAFFTNFSYNIRGWLTGINKAQFANAFSLTDQFFKPIFAQVLSYDAGFDNASAAFNGNISGQQWVHAGDRVQRAYGYQYDALNRLLRADFTQKEKSTDPWANTKMDFSTTAMAYDANGNIQKMVQRGYSLSGGKSFTIDSMAYAYTASSNRLLSVTDAADNTKTAADFKDVAGATDYTYDANGNLKSDQNKSIAAIAYNHLNLPQLITVTGKGTVAYTYDAAGTKLKKVTVEGTRTTTTDYLLGFEYRNDSLQQLMHPEGRTRYAKRYWQNGDSAYRWEWDYFYKDHLGNIRTTVTEQRDTGRYVGHAENTSQQSQLFYTNGPLGRQSKASIPAMPTNSDPNSAYVFRVSQQYGFAITGTAYACQKVMAGDSMDMKAEYWYLPNATAATLSTTPEGYNVNLLSMVSSRSSFRYAATLSSHGASVAAIPPRAGLNMAAALLLQMATNSYSNPGNNPVPKCYLNWLLLDEQLNYVEGSGGIMQIGAANPNAWQLLVKNGLVMPKSGYFISFYTNETDVPVYFDNIVINHRSGPLLQESDTYAFGGGIDALESRSFGRAENKYGYNGKEKQPDLGLEWLDYGARMYDAQVGRWFTVDPKANKYFSWTPYNYVANNPIKLIDQDGKEWVDAKGNLIYKNGAYTEYATGNQKRLGDELQRTKTGAEQFNRLINSPTKTQINFVDGKHPTDERAAASTKNGDFDYYTDDKTKEVVAAEPAKEATISIYMGKVDEVLKGDGEYGLYGKSTEGLSFMEVLAAIVGHEVEHTTKENLLLLVKYGPKSKQVEEKPTEKSNNIIDETTKKKQKPNN